MNLKAHFALAAIVAAILSSTCIADSKIIVLGDKGEGDYAKITVHTPDRPIQPATAVSSYSPKAVKLDPESYAPLINAAAKVNNLDPDLVRAVIHAESGFNPRAISPANAQGLMQLIPSTAKRMGVANSFDPIENVAGGSRYLRLLLDMFGGNVVHAVAGYNAGEGAVMKYGGIPPYKETQEYVRRVAHLYKGYKEKSMGSSTIAWNGKP